MSTPTGRTTGQNVLLVVGGLVLVVGLVCLVVGFSQFVGSQDDLGGDSTGRSMAFFAGGGLAMVVGFGIVAFTRVSAMNRGGGSSRVTIEQGIGPSGGRFCPSCGRPAGASARFCDSCGTALT